MKNALVKWSVGVAILLGGTLFFTGKQVFAHGYVESPVSRGYQGSLDRNTLGWSAAFEKYGNVISNPQSLETKKGFPEAGPVDGRIASADGGLGQIGDFVLDEQGTNRWTKQDINQGPLRVNWHYTAPHKTTKWHYYITKPGWDQNAPLSRDSLELIATVNHDGSAASNSPSHTITIPENRLGYHVILAVWDVADTPNAFYNVIDVNVSGSTVIPEKPTAPANVRSERVTSSTVALAWNGQTDAKEYNVYRDGALVATTTEPTFTDTQLKANTTYSYQVEAVGFTALVSEKSAAVKVTTAADNQVETPSTPGNLHQMSVTDSSVSLMWQASTHTNGIAGYDVYRNGVKIATATGTTYEDTNLAADTTYNYQIKAISKTGEQSAFSNQLSVKTNAKEETETPGGGESEYRVWKLGTFSAPEVYTSGEIVSHKGSNYVVINTHSNYGDATWSPDQAPTLFQKL